MIVTAVRGGLRVYNVWSDLSGFSNILKVFLGSEKVYEQSFIRAALNVSDGENFPLLPMLLGLRC